MSYHKIYVPLPPEAFEALRRLAKSQMRTPSNQASILLQQALTPQDERETGDRS